MLKNQNADPQELAKFERIAHKWWDKSGEFKPLHDMNPVRANYIDAGAKIAEKHLLDVGCGGGILSEAMAQRGAKVTGIDMGEAPLEVARLHALETGLTINYKFASAEDYAQAYPEQFDVITCLELLEHVPSPTSVISACAKLVKPGGHLFFSTINRTPKAYGLAVLGAEYLLKLLPKGTHDYQKFIRPAELASWIRAAQLELVDVCGMTYNPFNKKFALNPHDVDVNYIVHCRKPGGV